MTSAAPQRIRLAELLGVLSLGADLGMGQPMEHVLRQCLIALHLAERPGSTSRSELVVYYTSMLAWVGCHVDAYEQAKWFGDDLALKADFRTVDFSGPDRAEAVRSAPPRRRGAAAADGPASASTSLVAAEGSAAEDMIEQPLARRRRSGRATRPRARRCATASQQTFERWDGEGVPKGAKGADILATSQLVNLADVVEVFHRAGGIDCRGRGGPPAQRHPVRAGAGGAVLPGGSAAVQRAGGVDRAGTPSSPRSPEPGSGSSDAELDGGSGGDRRLRRPQVAVHDRSLAGGRGPGGGGGPSPRAVRRRRRRPSGGRAWSMTSGGSASPTRSGTSGASSPRRRPSGCGCIPT